MKHTKNLLALAISMLLLIGFIPVHAATIVESGTCGENLTWTLDSDGHLLISGTGDMEDYYNSYSTAPWCTPPHDANKIKTAEIKTGITSIGGQAFGGCSGITNITLPDSISRIGNYAFENCTSLRELQIPNDVTSIGYGAFYNTKIEELNLPAKVKYVTFAFDNCKALKKITVSPDNEKFCDIDGVLFLKDKKNLVHLPESYQGDYVVPDEIRDNLNMINAFPPLLPDKVQLSEDEKTLLYVPSGIGDVYTIPDSVETIAKNAFRHSNVTRIVIPNSVKKIEYGAFYNNGMELNDDIIIEIVYNQKTYNVTDFRKSKKYSDFENIYFYKHRKDGLYYPDGVDFCPITICNNQQIIPQILMEAGICEDSYLIEEEETTGVVYINEFALIGHKTKEILEIRSGTKEIISVSEDILELHMPNSIESISVHPMNESHIFEIYYYGAREDYYSIEFNYPRPYCYYIQPEINEILGDVSGDGEVTAEDARLALRAAVGLENYAAGSAEFLAADVDKSGDVTSADARLILRRAVGFADPEFVA